MTMSPDAAHRHPDFRMLFQAKSARRDGFT
jgi:hypothetical protein